MIDKLYFEGSGNVFRQKLIFTNELSTDQINLSLLKIGPSNYLSCKCKINNCIGFITKQLVGSNHIRYKKKRH